MKKYEVYTPSRSQMLTSKEDSIKQAKLLLELGFDVSIREKEVNN